MISLLLRVIPLTYPEGGEGPECVDVEHWQLYKNPFRYLGQICKFGAKKFKTKIHSKKWVFDSLFLVLPSGVVFIFPGRY